MKNLIRRVINKYIFANGQRYYYRTLKSPITGKTYYTIGNVNEWLFSKLRIKKGLGYNDNWIADLHSSVEIRTILDLGCNVGYFPLHLRYILGESFSPIGHCVDANKEILDRTIVNLAINDLDLICVNALVGPEQNDQAFHIAPSSEASSIYQSLLPHPFDKKTVVDVPHFDFKTIQHPVDICKVDIEGAELCFVIDEKDFIAHQVNNLIIEWHEPLTSPNRILYHINCCGSHKLDFIEGEGQDCGVMYFSRKGGEIIR